MSKLITTFPDRYDTDLIDRIITRAERELTLNEPRGTMVMDLMVCHAMACPLNLELFLAMPKSDFSHDFHGIVANMDRRELVLDNFFVPRCSVSDNPRVAHEDTVEQQDEDAMVSEWLGAKHLINFQACSVAAKAAFRDRYKESQHVR